MFIPRPRLTVLAVLLLTLLAPRISGAQDAEPQIGQPGKDVIWVPTPPELIDAMFTLAGLMPADTVVDLGSGDGRVVIAAARHGARARGVEFDAPLVTRSRAAARAAGVAGHATFVRADMFTAPIHDASVLALFLLPANLARLRDRFLTLEPGTRIVINTFEIPGWHFDQQVTLPVCDPWCTAKLWIVPARVEGTWSTPDGRLTLTQRYQQVSGTVEGPAGRLPITGGRVDGRRLRFTVAGRTVDATVRGDAMSGTISNAGGTAAHSWTAHRHR